MMPISVSAPMIASSASIAPKTPPPESRSLTVALLLFHSFQRSAKLGRPALQQGPCAVEIARQRVLMHRDLRHVLLDDVGRRIPQEPVEAEDEDGQIVELPDNRDEVRDDVDREREVCRD